MAEQEQELMTFFEAEAHSFVVRLWRENRDKPEIAAEWRGWIQHVQSGQRHHLRSISEISRIVSAYVGATADIPDRIFIPIQTKDRPE